MKGWFWMKLLGGSGGRGAAKVMAVDSTLDMMQPSCARGGKPVALVVHFQPKLGGGSAMEGNVEPTAIFGFAGGCHQRQTHN
ncbi:hypothetical protein RvY_16260 [Ramazzottius varieornatus]|uniref:Uncharacterized protein n=1 Tax=Ramazzottius varieornatus TaxID=947166 RepID=A0A1D1W5H9_RAMVA|nr:hypothetical protein RvY_16260 [Ramazzottius varieornatus]